MRTSVIAALVLSLSTNFAGATDSIRAIERVKPAVVAVGTYERLRSPQFQYRGTGFAVGDGLLIATNAHVVSVALDAARLEMFGILIPGGEPGKAQFREARKFAVDEASDLALLQIGGQPLPALRIGDSDGVKEGLEVLFTGFPIGGVLGPYAATHRAMVAAITPIAIPPARSSELNIKLLQRLAAGSYRVFQLDATAYPGNSGSPVYDGVTGEVVGVVNMVFVKSTKESALTQPSGITYAIPAKYLQELIRKER
jgi:S1-C subfamily serine protease